MVLCLMGIASLLEAQQFTKEQIDDYRTKWAREYFTKKGLPAPDGGVQVVSSSQISSLDKNEIQKNKEEYLKNGFISKYNDRAKDLLNFEIFAQHAFKNKFNIFDESTHLRHSIDELKMAYTFVGIPSNLNAKIIGVSPYLTFIKNEGWVGAVQFFNLDGIGICAFTENNIRLSHGSVMLAREDISEYINGKPAMTDVIGNIKSGYVYHIDWYGSDFFRELECATQEYLPLTLKKVVELANKIDSAS